MVYMDLKKSEFSAEKIKQYHDEHKVNSGQDDGLLNCVDDQDKVVIDEITSDGELSIHSESDFGYIALDVQLDTDHIVRLIEVVVKKMNRFKTALESLK